LREDRNDQWFNLACPKKKKKQWRTNKCEGKVKKRQNKKKHPPGPQRVGRDVSVYEVGENEKAKKS